MTYNVIPRQVEVVKYDGSNYSEVEELIGSQYKAEVVSKAWEGVYLLLTKGSHRIKIEPGCYVVKEYSGRVYNYNQHEFETYLDEPYSFIHEALD